MMGQIKEDTTGFVYNLDVQIQAPEGGMAAQVSAKGLAQSVVPQQNLSYSAPSADGSVDVGVAALTVEQQWRREP